MRLGGRVFEKWSDPDGWAHAVKRLGYSAAYCPVDEKADDAMCRAFSDAARRDGIVISEVGAWSNPIATDETERKKAVARNRSSRLSGLPSRAGQAVSGHAAHA